jgi:hypothetical protein
MIPPNKLEEAYAEFSENPQKWIPDGIINVNLNLLQELGLLSNEELEQNNSDNLMHYFHVIETPDKVTLFNEKFAIWIVPKVEGENPTTLTFIATLRQDKPHLEIVFATSGVYNTPRFILKVLQHFLNEVVDTESIISNIDKPTGS